MKKAILLINLFGQEKIDSRIVLSLYNRYSETEKRLFKTILSDMIIQSKCSINDLDSAILESGIKRTSNPAIMLRSGLNYNNLNRVFKINEDTCSIVLLMYLFRIGYKRRRTEYNATSKWWYNELSVDLITNDFDEVK